MPPTDQPAGSAPATYPSLAGRTVLVTGGATGIGEAIVHGFVRTGSRVAVLDIDVTAGEALAAELGPAVLFLPCDVTDIAALRTAIERAAAQLGSVRVLVNNAANDQRHRVEEVTPQQWDAAQAVNLRHHFFAAQAVVAGMRAAGGGRHRETCRRPRGCSGRRSWRPTPRPRRPSSA